MVEFILYVASQERARNFYSSVLDKAPVLDVPGMSEFMLGVDCKLGLMPEAGIGKILQPHMPDPALGNGVPRCELYIYTDDIVGFAVRLQKAGAKEISAVQHRDWGDEVGYYADHDGHIIAIAKRFR